MPKPDSSAVADLMDQARAYLESHPGPQHVAILVRDVLQLHPVPTEVLATWMSELREDAQFYVNDGGVAATVELAGQSDEPPEISAKTLGEHIEDAQASEQEQREEQDAASQDSEVAVTAAPKDPTALQLEFRDLTQQRKAAEKEADRLRKAAREQRALAEVLQEQLDALSLQMTDTETAALPLFQPEQQTITTAPVDTCDFYEMGCVAARAGTPESCYDTQSADANEQHRWLRGWQFETAALKEAKEAQVQALFLDALRDALMPHPGFLPLGEEQPKVKHHTVTWNERPHLVVDCIYVNGLMCDEWHLQPLFDRDEWATLHEPTYGPAIAGVDASDEAKATRTRGGQDCGRLVKVGRSVYVVGPRSGLVTVYTDSANQPSH